MVARCDELIARDPPIPLTKGRVFYDSCPADHATLLFDPYKPHEHLCPKCGQNWTDATFHGAWVRQFFGWLQKRLIDVGILYRLTGNETYARYVHKALRHFVTHYESYPLANNLLGPTRLFQSSFLEAFWLADMVIAYDLTQQASAYTPSDHADIKALFYASCALIRNFDEGRSNRQAFYNVGMGALGFLYSDQELIQHVLAGPHGFSYHMRESVLKDGLWYEGETYHFATLDHLFDLAEFARHRGSDLYGPLKAMCDAPLKVMLPDLTFPSRKDSWFGRGVLYHKDIYELAYARYGEARYGGLLAEAYRRAGGRQGLSWRSFLYLEPQLPELEPQALRPKESEPMPGTGVAILRGDEGGTYASTEYGHYGGGHGHPDRLHLNLYAGGRHWFLDPGTGYYHLPELGWYRSSLAHNTVVVDGGSQSRSEGKLTAFADTLASKVAQAVNDKAYQGVSMRRCLCLGDGFLLDVFDLASERAHTYDWALHSRAAPQIKGDAAPVGPLGERDGYEFLQDLRRLSRSELDVTFSDYGAALRVLQLGEAELFTARALGIPLREEVPMHTLIARRQGREARFITAHLFGEGAAQARLEELKPDHYELQLGERRYLFQLDGSPGLALSCCYDASLSLACFGKKEVALEGLALQSDKALSYLAFTLQGARLTVELPESFGQVRLRGLGVPVERVEGLPEGASWQLETDDLILTQAAGSAVWLEHDTETLRFFAGAENRLRFFTAGYAGEEGAPTLETPEGWELLGIERLRRERVSLWEARFSCPSHLPGEHERITLRVSGASLARKPRLEPPLQTGWSVTSEGGVPAILLTIREARGQAGQLKGTLEAPWLLEKPFAFSAELGAQQAHTLRLPLPLKPLKPRALSLPTPEGVWELPGLIDSAGEHHLVASLSLNGFTGITRASLPLYWATPRGAKATQLNLDRPEQAYWAELPWQHQADASARASLQWDEAGLYLVADVWDDLHVPNANEDDLYENDSLQVYFDVRELRRREAAFTPGVAAYILAPDADKTQVKLEAIAGSREISNRAAKASWFSLAEVTANAQPTPLGYRLEAFFPYRALGVSPLAPGEVIGFDLAQSDNDGTWYRKLQLVWSGARGRRCYIRGSYHNPLEYGYLIVGEASEA